MPITLSLLQVKVNWWIWWLDYNCKWDGYITMEAPILVSYKKWATLVQDWPIQVENSWFNIKMLPVTRLVVNLNSIKQPKRWLAIWPQDSISPTTPSQWRRPALVSLNSFSDGDKMEISMDNSELNLILLMLPREKLECHCASSSTLTTDDDANI